MARIQTNLGLTLMLLLGACAPLSTSVPVQIMPTFVEPEAENIPRPNEAYPTAQAAETGASRSVSGFLVSLNRAWRDGKQINAELCFTLPDTSDWTIWEAHFEYGGNSISEFGSAFLRKSESQDAQPAERCDVLTFYVPPDADLTGSSLTVEAVGAYPSVEEYCSVFLPKIQQTLSDRATGITVDCPPADGSVSLQITGKPEGMSQEEAEQLVFSDEYYTVRGPWSFPVTFDQ